MSNKNVETTLKRKKRNKKTMEDGINHKPETVMIDNVKYVREDSIQINKDARSLLYNYGQPGYCESIALNDLYDFKVSITVPRKIIVGDYSLTLCSDDAFSRIMKKTPSM